jgi:hypothetical protein
MMYVLPPPVPKLLTQQLILHIPFTQSLRALALYLLPPPPSHPLRPMTLKLYINLTHCPGFEELEEMRPLMDINIASPPRVARTADGLRDVEEWGLKVQKMANVHSITLAFVCPLLLPSHDGSYSLIVLMADDSPNQLVGIEVNCSMSDLRGR